MPQTGKTKPMAEKQKRHRAAYNRLREIIVSAAPDAEKFRRVLDEALAAGLPINWVNKYGWTLLHYAVNNLFAVRAGLPQILINAGANVNAANDDGRTPLGSVCWKYVYRGESDYLTLINILLAGRQNAGRRDAAGTRNALRESLSAPTGCGRSVAGARPELDEKWKSWDWADPELRARRDWLDVYIKTWQARSRAKDAAPEFDYAL